MQFIKIGKKGVKLFYVVTVMLPSFDRSIIKGKKTFIARFQRGYEEKIISSVGASHECAYFEANKLHYKHENIHNVHNCVTNHRAQDNNGKAKEKRTNEKKQIFTTTTVYKTHFNL